MLNIDKTNHELQLANDFVQHTDRNIFLTGKAGTGKTTFLRNLHKSTAKRLIVTAPTGVAAINAGGVTLHSFFQLSFGPFVPGSEAYEQQSQRQFRFSNEKKAIIKSLDLLIIDEISMVRADLLDAIDAALRRHRRNNRPFGGVQLLMIGDLHQLPPIAKPDEWQILRQHYKSVYFFNSKALQQIEMLTIELRHIYRQSDPQFIELLNRVRDNRLDEQTQAALNKRYIPDFSAADDHITLTTHNHQADTINQSKLRSLPGREYSFSATINGDFPTHIYPAPATLRLKKGAQVMFARNDSSPEKRYYNGKIGTIVRLSSEIIEVLGAGDKQAIEVEPEDWQNIKYTVNQENREIEEKVIGEFSQFPLKLAWAITIHKSQGLTFEKIIIDAQAAFAHGQVYVALSRCKSLHGIVLRSPISTRVVTTDEDVLIFDQEAGLNPPREEQLRQARTAYQQKLLFECFNFDILRSRLSYFLRLLRENSRRLHLTGLSEPDGLLTEADRDIFTVADNFSRQLSTIFAAGKLPEDDAHILERIGKASGWFQGKFAALFSELEQKTYIESDNAELRKKLNLVLNNLRQEIAVKRAGICCCLKGFSPADYLRAISKAELDFKPLKVKKTQTAAYTESDIAHPRLYQTLREWRDQQAAEQGVKHFQIMHQSMLIQIVVRLPDSKAELEKIPGVGPKTMAKYGDALTAMVAEYRREHGVTTVKLPETKVSSAGEGKIKNTAPSGTRDISLQMFQDGMTIAEIAGKRGLVESTIETHLCFFIENGRLEIGKLLSTEQQKEIEAVLDKLQTNSLSEVKAALQDNYTYGQIRMLLAWRNYQAGR
ncbi:DNA repair and recombination protein, putative helicase [hydrothermal vent metagenome]|uniref:DNA repair and recombination protein, putative helicase n=1 Tax=hydrothermal vent metagenome TaxID=652676 RepID=A0A3B0VPK9_9ZZZZ